MKIASVVCEFNPFHNGHAYLLEKLRKEYEADHIIAIMSGNYVQRGEPALFDKYKRAEMALIGDGADGHADLVIELPTLFSCASAREFAAAGVITALASGVTDILGFGVEGGACLSDIRQQARLIEELGDGSADNAAFKEMLRSGMSYPEAAAAYTESIIRRRDDVQSHGLNAVTERKASSNEAKLRNSADENVSHGVLCRQSDTADGDQTDISADHVKNNTQSGMAVNIYASNNILAAEYAAALNRYDTGHRIQPVAIQRVGDGYASEEASDDKYCSATALRKHINAQEARMKRAACMEHRKAEYLTGCSTADRRNCGDAAIDSFSSDISENAKLCEFIERYVPPALHGMYGGRIDSADADMLSGLLSSRLLEAKYKGADLTGYLDVSREIADRLMKNADRSMSFYERAAAVKTKQYTYTRVSRALLHIALGIERAEFDAAKADGYIRYLRILGLRKDASELLRALKQNASVPIISKTADASELLRGELYYSGIYNTLSGGRSEYERSPVIL